jgi:hypothetical protein
MQARECTSEASSSSVQKSSDGEKESRVPDATQKTKKNKDKISDKSDTKAAKKSLGKAKKDMVVENVNESDSGEIDVAPNLKNRARRTAPPK